MHDHGCHLASQFRLDLKDYEVVSPLVSLPWCHLVMPAGCRIASCRPLIAPPSHHLVVPAGCCIASCRPLIALPSCCLVVPAGCCIASCCPLIVAPPSRQLVKAPAFCRITSHPPLVTPRAALSSSRRTARRATLSLSPRLIVQSLVVLLRQLVVAPSSLVVLLLHCPLILSLCWLVVVLPVLVLPSRPLVVVHR